MRPRATPSCESLVPKTLAAFISDPDGRRIIEAWSGLDEPTRKSLADLAATVAGKVDR